MKKLLLLGPPGAGKGTQAKFISERYNIPQIATGDMLRQAIEAKSALGLAVKNAMNAGKLIADDIMIALVQERLSRADCQQGFILDGFPRTLPQATMLDQMLAKSGSSLTKVIHFNLADETVVKRVTGRRIHPGSGRSYHTVFNPPKNTGVDDQTGEPLIQRKDDNENTIKTRLQSYHNKTSPLIEYYRKQGVLATVQADQSIEQVYRDVMAVLPGKV